MQHRPALLLEHTERAWSAQSSAKAEIKHDHFFSHKNFKGHTSGQDEDEIEIQEPSFHENK